MTQMVLPQRCQEHKNHSAGCEDCKHYARVRVGRRTRLRAYGQWQENPHVDAGPAAQHVRNMKWAGVRLTDIAELAGTSKWTVLRLFRLDPDIPGTILSTTAQKILAVEPPELFVPGVGLARRLQALARTGWRVPDLVAPFQRQGPGYIDVRKMLYSYRRGMDYVHRASHLSGQHMYTELWDVDGPCRYAALRAEKRGWLPPEAWTDATIDDPDAMPYGDPDMYTYVDEIKLERARLPKGHATRIPFADLSFAEQVVLFREHHGKKAGSTTDRAFLERYRPVPAEIMRRLHQALRGRSDATEAA